MNYDYGRLSGRSRGYKQPGKKLLPRDSYLATMGGNCKSRARDAAGEIAHYGGHPDAEHSHYRRMKREFDSLPRRHQKLVEKALEKYEGEPMGEAAVPGVRLARAYRAMVNYDSVERCMQADDMMWRNCQ